MIGPLLAKGFKFHHIETPWPLLLQCSQFDLRLCADQAQCQGSTMTERKETTSQAEDTAPTVTCAKHEDSKVPQQGIAMTDRWLGDCGGS